MTGLASTPGQLSRSSSQSRTEAVVASWGAELVNSVSVGCYQGKVPSVGPCALLDGLCSVSLSVLPGVGPEVDHRCNASRTAAVDADVDLQRFPRNKTYRLYTSEGDLPSVNISSRQQM